MKKWFQEVPTWGRWTLALLCGLLVFGMLAMVFGFDAGDDRRTEKVGFIILGGIDEPGWNESHYEGIKSACETLGVALLVREHVAEGTGAVNEAIRSLADEGAGMIFLCSYGYPEEARETVAAYPGIAFATHAPSPDVPNITSCFPRMFQGRYLAGALAGLRTKTNVIGYVAAMPNAQVNRNLNAFALGALRANPNARIVVAWTGAWEDAEKEKENVLQLVHRSGADIITYQQDDQAVPDACETLGIDFISVNTRLANYPHHLASITCRWDIYYRHILQRYLKGELNAIRNRWIGIDEGAIHLADVSERIGLDAGYAVAGLRRDLEGFHPIFRGPIRDTRGLLRVGAGEVLHDDALLARMDWYVEGVEFLDR